MRPLHYLPLALITLAACASAPAAKPPGSVTFVAVSCVPPNLGPPLDGLETKESLRAIKDPAERYIRMAADWGRRVQRMAETEAVIADCRKVAN